MQIHVSFHSYFKDLTGCADTKVEMPPESSIADLLGVLYERYPKLVAMQRSTLIAVGVEYQGREYLLKDSDEVSMFPPVQGG